MSLVMMCVLRMGGDVTLVPSLHLRDFLRIISDPTEESMEDYMLRGQRATWPALARIKNFLHLEQTLDACARTLAKKAEAEPLSRPPGTPSNYDRDSEH